MTSVVVDASVAAKWFRDERLSDKAQALLADHRAGTAQIWTPSLFILEMINTAARRWGWTLEALQLIVDEVEMMAFTTADADPRTIAEWTARGLSAYDAAYAGLADMRGVRLVTDDRQVIQVATEVVLPLESYSAEALYG